VKHKVIAGKNLPAKLPIALSVALWLLMDRYHAPGWLWGVVGTVMAIYWILEIVGICTQEPVDMFDKGPR